jgi:hypothetical protein
MFFQVPQDAFTSPVHNELNILMRKGRDKFEDGCYTVISGKINTVPKAPITSTTAPGIITRQYRFIFEINLRRAEIFAACCGEKSLCLNVKRTFNLLVSGLAGHRHRHADDISA